MIVVLKQLYCVCCVKKPQLTHSFCDRLFQNFVTTYNVAVNIILPVLLYLCARVSRQKVYLRGELLDYGGSQTGSLQCLYCLPWCVRVSIASLLFNIGYYPPFCQSDGSKMPSYYSFNYYFLYY